jgi:hypothetical protein
MKKELGEAQREFRDKINKLIEKEKKIGKLIKFEKRWHTLLKIKNDDKDETTRILNNHKKIIDPLTKMVDTLFVESLAY